ncbi:UNVERIFIED_CONTAM: hypothetical protein BEN50_04870 [Euhalothece sp. KZN 001]
MSEDELIFPRDADINGETVTLSDGLTKREYFAVMALQGLAANPDPDDLDLPRSAVSLADELIEELNKEEE